MRKFIIPIALLLLPATVSAVSNVRIDGSEKKVITINPEANTGLNQLFVVYNATGCTLQASVGNGYTATVYRYANLGGGYAEEIKDIDRSATSISLPLEPSDMGYIIEDGDSRYYCWIVDYSKHTLSLSSVTADPEPDCNYSVIDIAGDASPITYYAINGQPKVLSRDITVAYTTQVFDKDLADYVDTDVTKVYESLGNRLSITPPALCSTYFTFSGDRFLKEWGMEVTAETGLVTPFAVECSTEAIQEESDSDEPSNVIKGDDSGLGGSAPANISFLAYTSDAVLHYEWQMSRDREDFENPEYRFYQKDLDYTFTEEGQYYLRFIGSNADGSCEAVGDTYTVSIGASALECPNAFSPNGDGVNDIWKVSYRSLLDFHCEIFNRTGQRIYGFDDPSGGWDGTWHGKTVKPGVYYYVITATGSDGKKYKKSGDINIINSVTYGNSGGTTEPGE